MVTLPESFVFDVTGTVTSFNGWHLMTLLQTTALIILPILMGVSELPIRACLLQ